MNVTKNIENTILSLKTQIGTTSNGKPRYKSYSFSSIDVAATDEALYTVAKSMATLFDAPIDKITRQDLGSMTETTQS